MYDPNNPNKPITILSYLTFEELTFRLRLIFLACTRRRHKPEIGISYHPRGNKISTVKVVDFGIGWVKLETPDGKTYSRSSNGFEKNFIRIKSKKRK